MIVEIAGTVIVIGRNADIVISVVVVVLISIPSATIAIVNDGAIEETASVWRVNGRATSIVVSIVDTASTYTRYSLPSVRLSITVDIASVCNWYESTAYGTGITVVTALISNVSA